MWTVMCTHVYVGRHRHTKTKARCFFFFFLHSIQLKFILFFLEKIFLAILHINKNTIIERSIYFLFLVGSWTAHLIMRCNPFHGQYFGLLGLLNLSLWPYLFKSSFETGLA